MKIANTYQAFTCVWWYCAKAFCGLSPFIHTMLQWDSNSDLLCLPPHFPDEAAGAQKSNNFLVSGKAETQARFCLTLKPVPLTMIPNWSVHKHTSFTPWFVLENVNCPNLFSSFHRAWHRVRSGNMLAKWMYVCWFWRQSTRLFCLFVLFTRISEKFQTYAESGRSILLSSRFNNYQLKFLFVLYLPLDLFHISDIIFHRVLIF